jgi:hypothetical protein
LKGWFPLFILKRMRNGNLNFHRKHLPVWVLAVMIFMTFHNAQILAQNATESDTLFSEPLTSDATRKLFGGAITNSGYGGPVVKFSRFNNQFAIMTGGRGACTINNRYTLGGGGYGIASSIILPGSGPDTTRYFKMGYGGPELGYIFVTGEKVNIGVTLLIAAGSAFSPGKPKSNTETLFGNEFNFLFIIEPLIYGELALSRFMRLHAGLSYRHVNGSDLSCMKVRDMKGFSCYVGLLFGK